MSVVIETTLGDLTVDLYLYERPRACSNFLKLCKLKYYNYNLFHTISRGFMAQSGDPTGSRTGGESIFGVLEGPLKRYFQGENEPRIKHTKMGLISFVGNEDRMIGSQFFLTLGEDLTYLDEKHCVFGEVVEGFEVLEQINEVICDTDDRPYQDVRVTHTVVLDDPYPDPKGLRAPSRSPSPSAERLQGGRIAPDEEIDEMEGKTAKEITEMQAQREALARATILEMVGDIPDADMAPPENVLFVCKLNPVTTDDDLEIIFSRFGKIKTCEVIRDRKTGDSLQYAFIEFEERKSCEEAYFKMDNVLIDDRRIHVDFSQSVSKVKWLGKGRGVAHFDEHGKKRKDNNNDVGQGRYKANGRRNEESRTESPDRRRHSKSPRRRENVLPNRNTKKPDRSRSPRRNRSMSRSPKRKNRSVSRSPKRKNRSRSRSAKRRIRSKSPRRDYPRDHNDSRDSRFNRYDDRYKSSRETDRYSRKEPSRERRSKERADIRDRREVDRYRERRSGGRTDSRDRKTVEERKRRDRSEERDNKNGSNRARKRNNSEMKSGDKKNKKKETSDESLDDSDSEDDKKYKKKKKHKDKHKKNKSKNESGSDSKDQKVRNKSKKKKKKYSESDSD